MQGEGMSLSAEEKVRVAHLLDELGDADDRGRLPGLEPQGGRALRAARAASASRADVVRVRDDAPARRRAPPTTRRCALLADVLRAGLHARRQDLGAAPREGRARRPRGEPADDRRVGRVPRRRRASASSTTPSTSSTAARDDPAYALRCLRAAAEAGAENVDAVRHQRRARCRTRSRAAVRGRARALPDAALGIHCHNDAECGVANSLAGGAPRARRWCRAR